ncbi:MAG: rhodanese-related sulfurtransferase [Hyphomicrobium sp.]|nr:rhodanese-related sulfurtransferase [Hyphomicrobium sp.]
MRITISAFYKFVAIDDPETLKAEVAAIGCQHGIKGTILVAHEGINSTVSGTADGIAALLGWLRADSRFSDLISKESYADAHPFGRFKVKVKPEIVTFGHPEVNPAKGAGTYVPPQQWNALIEQPDVLVVDTRNSYEFDIGTFRGAVDPKTQTFRQFAKFVDETLDPSRHRRVAMFCTGGIRCEKSTAYLRAQGFDEVYHLEGGILKYLEVVPEAESLWQGECFIFDERVALEHGVKPGSYQKCPRCGYPVRRSAAAADATAACPNCTAQ